MPANITIRCNDQTRNVPPVWRGENLAVHRPVIKGGGLSDAPRHWAITHTASGLAACLSFDGSKQSAVALARLWDAAFQSVPLDGSASQWHHRNQWLADLKAAQLGDGKLSGPQPITPLQQLQAATTPAQVQAAVARAMGYDPMGDDEASQQFEIEPDFIPAPGRVPYNGAIQRKPSGSLWLFWIPQGANYRDQAADLADWYQVPLIGEIEDWTLGSVACTPCDDDCEPDHPDSWLRILGMI